MGFPGESRQEIFEGWVLYNVALASALFDAVDDAGGFSELSGVAYFLFAISVIAALGSLIPLVLRMLTLGGDNYARAAFLYMIGETLTHVATIVAFVLVLAAPAPDDDCGDSLVRQLKDAAFYLGPVVFAYPGFLEEYYGLMATLENEDRAATKIKFYNYAFATLFLTIMGEAAVGAFASFDDLTVRIIAACILVGVGFLYAFYKFKGVAIFCFSDQAYRPTADMAGSPNKVAATV